MNRQLKIGLALHRIGQKLDDKNLEKVKEDLEEIESLVLEWDEEEKERNYENPIQVFRRSGHP